MGNTKSVPTGNTTGAASCNDAMGTASSTAAAEGKTTCHTTGHMTSSAKGIATGDTFVDRAACSRLLHLRRNVAQDDCDESDIILGSQMISMLHCTNQQQQLPVLTKLSSTSQLQAASPATATAADC